MPCVWFRDYAGTAWETICSGWNSYMSPLWTQFSITTWMSFSEAVWQQSNLHVVQQIQRMHKSKIYAEKWKWNIELHCSYETVLCAKFYVQPCKNQETVKLRPVKSQVQTIQRLTNTTSQCDHRIYRGHQSYQCHWRGFSSPESH